VKCTERRPRQNIARDGICADHHILAYGNANVGLTFFVRIHALLGSLKTQLARVRDSLYAKDCRGRIHDNCIERRTGIDHHDVR